MLHKWAHYDWSERVQYFYLETFICIKINSTIHSVRFLKKYWMTNVKNSQLTSSGMPANPAALKP